MRPWWHQLKGKLFEAELVFTFWHSKSSSPLYAKASYNNHQRAIGMPQSAQIRCWLPLNPLRQTSRQRGPEGARELSGSPHPPVLLLHQLGDSNRILNEGMRHAFQQRRHRLHSPIKAAQHSLNTPSNDPPWTQENCTLASSIFDRRFRFAMTSILSAVHCECSWAFLLSNLPQLRGDAIRTPEAIR